MQEVKLHTGGELTHTSARCLANRGWGLFTNKNEAVRFVSCASSRAAIRDRNPKQRADGFSESPARRSEEVKMISSTNIKENRNVGG